ncbi:MAG TPA: tRNA preQ1(34) S-adenosylmethionine ribosyltransferase-isomerase QueA [Tepidisphaeraceae bacterium]|nr:tRNA preQ1(34) S-adenosylmethionine ribosyltransferase-isomerase QueA [Tepidisphaeraceae bacterium]
MRTDDLDFHLPPQLIAQMPANDRAASRLLHYRRADRAVQHLNFTDLPALLRAGDLLVFNDARVTPARFTLTKPTGGIVEGLLVGQTEPRRWRVMLKNLGPVRPEMILRFANAPHIDVRVIEKFGGGESPGEVAGDPPAIEVLERIGRMPMPPYIRREKLRDERDDFDRHRYQTVYAKTPGSIAAPTAGLHFTDPLFKQLDAMGVQRTFVTLHVGLGTFKPITADTLAGHQMHVERYTIGEPAADALTRAKREGRRIIAVGTTSARVLESQPAGDAIASTTGETGIFIHPPYDWRHVGAMITNFHLPRSTLIALVAAMIGLDEQRRVYNLAIRNNYRFFSYGDAMFIE